ncbi:MAG TPA: hypothetical protein VG939_10355 [Caulobacteraceae bacterium]|nr:hypothetical protein [Caulobacteraceae bacterium]
MRLAVPTAGALFALLALPVLAAEPPQSPPPPIQAVIACKSIADAAQRLACYDEAVPKMAQAEASGEVVSVDREQRRAVRRQAFGLQLPSLTLFDRGEKAEDVDRLTFKVTQAWQDGQGKWVVKLDTGAVWRQIDDYEVRRPPHDGSSAEVRKGMLGSFFMKIDGQQQIRVHRDS